MVKQTPTICRLLPANCLSVFNHFAGLALKRLIVVLKIEFTPRKLHLRKYSMMSRNNNFLYRQRKRKKRMKKSRIKAGANQSNISSNIFSPCLMKCWMKNYVFHMTNFLVYTRSSNIPSNIRTFIHS